MRLVSKDTRFCIQQTVHAFVDTTEATTQQPRCFCDTNDRGLCSSKICVSCGQGRCGRNTCSLGLDVANLTGVVAARVGFEELELFLLLKERLGLIKPTSCSFRLGSSSSQAQSHAFEYAAVD